MADVVYRPATLEDARTLIARMRAADVRECVAAGSTPVDSVMSGLRDSKHCWALDLDGKLAALFGVAVRSHLSDVGGAWMLGTDTATRYKRRFVLALGDIVDQLLERYRVLVNAVHVENEDAVKWLQYAGFTLCPPVAIPPHGALFSVFYKERACV